MTDPKFIICRSDTGDGGWSLHQPGATDADIGNGDAPYLVSGPAEWDEEKGEWNRPNEADYRAAELEQLRAEAQRALDHYDLRSELYTIDADVAAGMAGILRAALK